MYISERAIKEIQIYQDKLEFNLSEIEILAYQKAITLLNEDVNVDKVKNWVSTTIQTFNNVPKPLSENQKNKIAAKKLRKSNRINEIKQINDELKTLIDLYDLIIIGNLEVGEYTTPHYKALVESKRKQGLYVTSLCYGYESQVFVSKHEVNHNFIEEFNQLKEKLDDISTKDELVDPLIYDGQDFINRLISA